MRGAAAASAPAASAHASTAPTGRARPAAGVDHRALPLYGANVIDVPFVIAGSRETMARDTDWAEHSHPTHELLWNQHGTCSARIGPRVYTITPSIGLWIPAGMPHSGWTPAGTVLLSAQFRARSVPSLSTDAVAVDVTPLLALLLDRLGVPDLTEASRTTTETLVLDVLAPAPHELVLRVPESELLAPVVTALRRDPADGTTLAEWADRCGVSSRTITRAFRAETGLGFSAWVATARAQYGIRMLAQGLPIDEVALGTGFRSVSAFGTAFRRVTGMSPGRFRAQ